MALRDVQAPRNEGRAASLTDEDYELKTVKSVQPRGEGSIVTWNDGWSNVFPSTSFEVKPGMVAKVYPHDNFGRPIRGIVFEEGPVWYRTAEEEKMLRNREIEEARTRRREEFEKHRASFDADFEALPPEFQALIAKCRAANPDFRWEHEPYELFACSEATTIAKWVKETGGAIKDAPVSDEHSGNTEGFARLMARVYLEQPELVPKAHAAIATIIGCKDAGCHGN